MFLTWFECIEQDVQKKFLPFCWPASNWRAGESPLKNLATSLIITSLRLGLAFAFSKDQLPYPQSRVFADHLKDTSLIGTTEIFL